MARRHSGTEKVDVNLVPMIDIMFQLIAFFTMLINMDNVNRDERIRLPIADLAKPTEMAVDELLTLNVNRQGKVNLLGDLVDVEDDVFRQFMIREAAAAQREMKRARRKIEVVQGRPKLWTTVMIRADAEVEYARVQYMIRVCQEMGFTKFALRATAERAE
jgi:biopolymer transport protein ExbD